MSDAKNRGPKDSHYARLRRARRDARPATRSRGPGSGDAQAVPEGLVRLYGLHTVRAALDNPRRTIRRMHVTRNAAQRLELGAPEALPFETCFSNPREIDAITGPDAVHQGVVVDAEPLGVRTLAELGDSQLVLVLDQVTDPHNVGAIIRSAVAFGATALITTFRHSPGESSVLAKAASGALEYIDLIQVRNLATSIEDLHTLGFCTVGLDSEAPEPLDRSFSGHRIALVLGAEGKGLRHKTRETVNILARLDMPGPIKSLNVSNAAAISLFAARRFLAERAPVN